MERAVLSLLSGWTNFYVIVGSSAGALIGLQFVVMTLIAQGQVQSNVHEIRAFGTPTVVHFGTALLLSAIMAAPWHALSHVAFCILCCGVAGVGYALRIVWHARKARYQPDLGDWIWYVILPLTAHALLFATAILLWRQAPASLFVIAAIALLFLFVGIHNAWDTVTYIATRPREHQSAESER
ncbi:MAG TPA: hypothetical protein VFB14_15835 [Bryobacteraceae bacterium]|jgi:hypothetical protein|nr:hypothetical protein [Bryobacteraceae bacterium]